MQSTLDTSATALLQSLTGRGLTVSTKGDGEGKRLTITPKSLLNDSDRAQLRQLKPELVALLESAGASTGAHRWAGAAAPDVAALSDAIERARHEHWIKPTVELMAIWREFESYHGRPINSQELTAMASTEK